MNRIDTTLTRTIFATLAITLVGFSTGCTVRGDTSGFKAEQKPSKAVLNQQIADIQANPKIPAGIKATAIKKLQQDMATAK